MIDPEGTTADVLRTAWIWFLVTPALQPVLGLVPELGFVFGVTPPRWVELLIGVLIAAGIVQAGERRYGRLVVASLGTAIVWSVVGSALGLTNARVHGSPRLVAAQFLLWVGAVSLFVALVFYTEWDR